MKAAQLATAEYAAELLAEMRDRLAKGEQLHPHRAAFIACLDERGTDARTKQFKHFDRIQQWMQANWAHELDPFCSCGCNEKRS